MGTTGEEAYKAILRSETPIPSSCRGKREVMGGVPATGHCVLCCNAQDGPKVDIRPRLWVCKGCCTERPLALEIVLDFHRKFQKSTDVDLISVVLRTTAHCYEWWAEKLHVRQCLLDEATGIVVAVAQIRPKQLAAPRGGLHIALDVNPRNRDDDGRVEK